ncbi:MAG TPA: PilZ domain-containing protein [Tepidisphaeraceae bacterium]|jgi:hypothetical protein|nr:PilZ domain-containing protein [Tepidisphaeraceae bacterium]
MLNHTALAAKPKNGQQTPPQTPRRSRRDKLMAMAQLWNGDKPDAGAPTQVLVSNISLEGVAVRTNEPLTKGAIHYVRMTAGPLKLETAIRIAWCRSREGLGFEAGAEFIKPS